MMLTEVNVAFILMIDVVISVTNFLFDMINGVLPIVNGNNIRITWSMLNGVHISFPSINIYSNFND